MTITLEQGFSEIQPFTVFAADGTTPDTGYVVAPADLTSGNTASVRVTLLPDNRSMQFDALGGSGSNIQLVTRVGGAQNTHTTVELVTVTAPVDRSGAVFGTVTAPPFRTPA
jgi:hypothetical protein